VDRARRLGSARDAAEHATVAPPRRLSRSWNPTHRGQHRTRVRTQVPFLQARRRTARDDRRVNPDVVVVGAGVIGLTTAVCLAEAGLDVLVRTAELPHETTSAVAGAMCGPAVFHTEARAARWARAGEREFRALAERPDTGVHVTRGRLVSNWGDGGGAGDGGGVPPWAADVPGFALCTPEERAGFRIGFWAELPFADMPRYLSYLTRRAAAAGVRIIRDPVGTLADAGASAPVVVNCTGVAARHLANDATVEPVKGQHVVVENPGLTTFFYEGGGDTEWTGHFPHGDRVVLGGVAIAGDPDRTPDPAVAEKILARNVRVEPRLAGARILGHEAGLRPVRPAVRLDEERLAGGARCIHNYGHGSVGVTLSWGCAQDVAALVVPGQPR
jgi:D-amino-acid oxidase